MRTHILSKIFYSLGISAVVYGIFIGREALGFFENHELDISEPTNYTETITVVADKNFAPFSFMTSKGKPAGADIEMLYAMAHEMKVNVKFIFAERKDAMEMVKNQEADALFGIEYTKDYAEEFELTDPVFVNQFVAFGLKDYDGINDLLTKRLGILTYISNPGMFITQLAHMKNVSRYASCEMGLQAVMDGRIDYLIGRYSVSMAELKKHNMPEIHARGDVLATSVVCFGLTKGNIELKERMDKALYTLQHSGVTLIIADKWLTTFSTDERIYQFIRQHKNTIVPCLFFLTSLLCIYLARYIANLKEKSYRDVATGLYNKKETENLVTKSINSASAGMMVLIDIDDFKGINDTYGHAVGDDCILHVAVTLRNCFRTTDIIGRVGGDEFMVYAPNITTKDNARKKIALVLEKFTMVSDAGHSFPLHISVGYALHGPHEMTFAELYYLADNAMYEAKNTGKNHACFAGEL